MSYRRDLTFKLPDIRTQVEVWSSDPITFNIGKKLINITLDNTVSDVLEIITLRSREAGGNLNPRCMHVYYRNDEVLPYQPLSDFFKQEHHVNRLRVEVNKELLGNTNDQYITASRINVNLILASGKFISLKKPMDVTVSLFRPYVVRAIGLDESHIDHFEYGGGLTVDDEQLSLSELLELDAAPLGELNLYVGLVSDFKIRLSSPVDGMIRSTKVGTMLDTPIITIKQYIMDQYTGKHELRPEDIKIICFGRALKNSQRVKDLINSSTFMGNLTIHYLIKEPEEPTQSQGFWKDLKRGKLFEFLPREPNPRFREEAQRDERLREQMGTGGRSMGLPSDSIRVSDPPEHDDDDDDYGDDDGDDDGDDGGANEEATPNHSLEGEQEQLQQISQVDIQQDTPEEVHRGTNNSEALEDYHLTGKTFDIAADKDGREVNFDEVEWSTETIEVVVDTPSGSRYIELSSSQAMINDLYPGNPFIMLSPSGLAKLQTLDVIDIPRIEVEEAEITQAQRIELPLPPTGAGTRLNIDVPEQLHNAMNFQPFQFQMEATGDLPALNIRFEPINHDHGTPWYRRLRNFNFGQNIVTPLFTFLKYLFAFVMIFPQGTSTLGASIAGTLLLWHFLAREDTVPIRRGLSRILPNGVTNVFQQGLDPILARIKLRGLQSMRVFVEAGMPLEGERDFKALMISMAVSTLGAFITFIPVVGEEFIGIIERRQVQIELRKSASQAAVATVNGRQEDNEHFENIDREVGSTGVRMQGEQ